jgi:signal transduction histidine kinase
VRALQTQSLAFRLGLIAAGGSLLALVLAGAVMATLQRAGAERSFDQRLAFFVSQLFADFANDRVKDDTPHFANPAFGLPGSGWYWAVADVETGEPLLGSQSLFDPLPPPNLITQDDGSPSTQAAIVGEQAIRLAERRYELDDEQVLIRVSAPTNKLELEIRGFQLALLLTLGLMWLVLLALAYVQVRVGLLPLKSLQSAIADVRAARSDQVEGKFPTEVSPLVDELNGMIRTNAAIIERARHHVGNLAHALKTPLAVILNTAKTPENPQDTPEAMDRIAEEARAIEGRVRVYLDRAQRAALQGAPSQATPLKEALDPLVRTMAKLSQDQNLHFDVDVEDALRVRADRQDVEEMLGNLLENASRYAHSAIKVSAVASNATQIDIHIDDDGQGIEEEARKTVLKRGQRLDEARPGSGLGLSIVQEMVELYGGSFSLSDSPMGGARATLCLPQAAPVPTESARLTPH